MPTTPSSQQNPPAREIGVYHLQNGIKNLLFCASSPSKPALYYAEIEMLAKNIPDVKLYSLPLTLSDTTSPELGGILDGTKLSGEQARGSGQVCGAAWFRNVQKTHLIKLCLGDPEKVRGVVWSEMRETKKHTHGEYVFHLPEAVVEEFENDFGTGFRVGLEGAKEMGESEVGDKQRVLCWRRTHSKESGLENAYLSRKWSAANFKLVDDEGRILAVFESNGVKSFRKQGKLKIYQSAVEEGEGTNLSVLQRKQAHFELAVVLSFCVIQEKYRRGH